MQVLQIMKYQKDILGAVSLQTVATPLVGARQVLVRMRAAAFNPADNHIINGEMAMMSPRKPPFGVGIEGAGVIESLGTEVSNFQVGDAVFFYTGLAWGGTLAEYCVVDASACTLKPQHLDFSQAAACALALLCAHKSLERGQVGAGSRVLIHGAGGAVGAAAVWLAKLRGAQVEATGNAADADYVSQLGAQHFYDYRTQTVSSIPAGFDMVLDGMGGAMLADSLPLLKPNGVMVSLKVMTGVEDMLRQGMKINGLVRFLMPIMFRKPIKLAQKAGVKLVGLATYPDGVALAQLAQFAEQYGFVPRIAKTFPLAQAAEALRYFNTAKPRGKVVVEMPQTFIE